MKDSIAPVSVIIPCFNCADTIARAIDSIVMQTLPPAEVILVDDASDDNTIEIIKSLQQKYGKDWLILIKLNVNGGPSVARNAGWDVARQPYIAFLDADDSWHVKKIELQYEWMSSHPEVSLTGHGYQWLIFGEVGKLLPEHIKTLKITKWRQLLSNRFATTSVMLKRNLHFRFASDKRHSEDNLLWCEAILSGQMAYYVDAPLAYAYKAPYGETGLTSSLWKMQKGQLNSYMRLHRKKLLSHPFLFFFFICSFVRFFRRIILLTVRVNIRNN